MHYAMCVFRYMYKDHISQLVGLIPVRNQIYDKELFGSIFISQLQWYLIYSIVHVIKSHYSAKS